MNLNSVLLKWVVTGCALAFMAPAQAEDWRWSVTPYLWAIGTELKTSVEIPEGGEQRFSDLIDRLDFAAQVHLEGQRGRHGFMLDVTNLQLSDRINQGPFEIDTDSSTTLVEGAALIGLTEGDALTQLMVGFRLLDVDFDLEIEGAGPAGFSREASMDRTLTDFLVGIRHHRPLSERWQLMLRGDVASGDTKFSWNLSALLGRAFGEHGQLVFGYRYMDVEFGDQQDLLNPQLAINGPAIGYSFRF